MFEDFFYFIRGIIKKPFKLGLISYYYPFEKNIENGVAIHAYYLSRALAKLGCDVHVFTRGKKNTIKKEYLDEGRIVIHSINSDFDYVIDNPAIRKRMSYFIFDNKVINEINKENKKEKFEIIHTHGWLTAGAFISKFFNNIKWVHTFHAVEKNRLKFMSEEEKKYYKIANWIESTIKNADALIAVSENLKQEILESYKIDENKLVCIPNGVDLSIFNHFNMKKEQEQVLYIGRFSFEKGIDLIPEIASYCLRKNKKIKFVIVSPEQNIPSFSIVRKKMKKLEEKYKERFIWYKSALSREKLAELYKNSSVYIQPSVYESFGLCVLEAMACGCVVVCSDRGGLPEVVGNAGFTTQLDAKKFSEKILQIIEDKKIMEKYSNLAVEKARSFSWDKIVTNTLKLYKQIAKDKNRKHL